MTEEHRQGKNRENGEDKMKGMGLRLDLFHNQHGGNKDQQPEQWIATNFLKKRAHLV